MGGAPSVEGARKSAPPEAEAARNDEQTSRPVWLANIVLTQSAFAMSLDRQTTDRRAERERLDAAIYRLSV